MKTAAERLLAEAVDAQVGLEALQLAAEGVAAADDSRPARGARGRRRSSRRRCPGSGRPTRGRPAMALSSPSRSMPMRHRGRLAAGDHQAVEADAARSGIRTSVAVGAERLEHERCALRSRPGGRGRRSGAVDRSSSSSRGPAAGRRRPRAASISRPGIASPSSIEACATRSGSSKWVVASTIARARRAGSSLLKIPEPTKMPSAPSCIISAASAGVAMPPAQNSGTGSQPRSATSRTTSSGAWRSLAAPASSSGSQRGEVLDAAGDLAHVANGLDDVAGAGLALGADHRRALADAPQRLTEVGRAADERDLEGELVDVVGLVGRASGPRTRRCSRPRATGRTCASAKWPIRALAITGIVTASWISLIMAGFDMRATPPSRPDVGRDALERHHRAGAGVLGDLRLVGVGDVHDHAALEHLGETGLDAECGALSHCQPHSRRAACLPGWRAGNLVSYLAVGGLR